MRSRKPIFRFWWPKIVDQKTAQQAAAEGAAMAGFQAIVTLVIILTHTFGFDLWELFDVGLLILLAWLIYWRLSRVAAVSALIYYIAGQVLFFTERPQLHPDIRVVLYSLMYLHGIRGTVAYWKYAAKRSERTLFENVTS